MFVRHVRLQDKAYTEIRKFIVEGTLARGEFLTEGELVARLGMSRTPVRSALHRLEQDGLVRIFPKQGIYIPELSVAQIHEMYDLRIALETFAVRRLTTKNTAHKFSALREILDLQRQQLELLNTSTFMIEDTRFHVSLIQFLENKELMLVFERNSYKLLMFGQEIFKRDIRRLELSYAEHCEILDAMEHGDGQKAAMRMEEHLLRGRAILLNGHS